MNKKEVWKDIKDYEGMYQVSNRGRVKSMTRLVNGKHGKRQVNEKIKSINERRNGYMGVQLHNSNKANTKSVHRLVAKAFLHDYSDSLMVNHKDLDVKNNKLSNLEMVTNSQNVLHALRFKDRPQGIERTTTGWAANITINGKTKHIAVFATKLEAYQCYYTHYKNLHSVAPWSMKTQKEINSNPENKIITKLKSRTNPRMGVKRGAFESGKRFCSSIRDGKNNIYLGTFETKEEAHNAFYNKYKELHDVAPW